MPRKVSNDPYCKKPIYSIPYKASKHHYVIVYKLFTFFDDNYYEVKKVKNLYHYMSINQKKSIILYKYYEIENFDFDCIQTFKEEKSTYCIPDLPEFYRIIESKYNIEGTIPRINRSKNPCIKCKHHRFTPSNNDEMISHLKECDTYEYTLFGESVPKNLLQGKKKSNVTIINNTNTQNIYNNYVSFRQTGDFIRSKLSVEQKREILNSIDKVGELVKLHFQYDEVKNNIVLKNISPYKSCEIFDGKSFIVVNNHEIFRYYVMDQLDTLDYFAVVDVKDPVLTRRLERYDDHIRKNDKHMLAMINKTMLQVKAEISKIKKK